MAAAGADLGGEARLVDAMVTPGSRILDAGCGPGRVAAELHRRGHIVVGVDVDPKLIAAAERDHPGPTWVVADLADMELSAQGITRPFDAAVVAGNVMTFLAAGSESAVMERIAHHLIPDGFVIIGFGLDRGYSLADFDSHCRAASLDIEHRFATWDLRPFRADSGFAVTVLRLPM